MSLYSNKRYSKNESLFEQMIQLMVYPYHIICLNRDSFSIWTNDTVRMSLYLNKGYRTNESLFEENAVIRISLPFKKYFLSLFSPLTVTHKKPKDKATSSRVWECRKAMAAVTYQWRRTPRHHRPVWPGPQGAGWTRAERCLPQHLPRPVWPPCHSTHRSVP